MRTPRRPRTPAPRTFLQRPFLVLYLLLPLFAACATTEGPAGEEDLPERIDQYRNDIQALRGNLQSPDDEVRHAAYDRIVELREEIDLLREDLTDPADRRRYAGYREDYSDVDRQLSALEVEGTRARLNEITSRDRYEEAFRTELQRLDRAVQRLEGEASTLGSGQAQEFERVLAGLEQRRQRLQGRLGGLRDVPETRFRGMQQGMTEDLVTYTEGVRRAQRYLDLQNE